VSLQHGVLKHANVCALAQAQLVNHGFRSRDLLLVRNLKFGPDQAGLALGVADVVCKAKVQHVHPGWRYLEHGHIITSLAVAL
jgi:hypothetical protein